MKSLFVSLYVKLIIAICLAFSLTWFGYSHLAQQRELNYWQQQMAGFIYLVEQGASRHQGQTQKTWLDIAFRLTGLTYNLDTTANRIQNSAVITRVDKTNQYQGQILLADTEIEFYFSSLTKQFAEGVNKLIANELGRVPANRRTQVLAALAEQFHYPLRLVESESLSLSEFELQQLASGLVLFRFDQGISTLSSIGQNTILINGPVPAFNKYPTAYLLLASCILFSLTLLIALFLNRPLERRFSNFSTQLDSIQFDQQQNVGPVILRQEGEDQLANLSLKVEDMANRIIGFAQHQQQMTRAVSHEIRTPLVKMNYRLASLEATELNAQQTKTINHLKANIAELDQLVNELLFYSSLDQMPKPETKSHNIEELLRTWIKPLQTLSDKTIRLSCKGEQKAQHTCENYLQRIVQNLITNAQRYARSQILVKVIFNQNGFVLSVDDDGKGVSAAMKERIFEPFVVDDESRNNALNGHGLGLSIVKKMTHLMQGKVLLNHSESLGGASFSIDFQKTISS